MTPEKIAEWRALCDAATPGPWFRDECGSEVTRLLCADDPSRAYGRVSETVADYLYFCDADFIAAARTALPDALDEIERLNIVNDQRVYERDRALAEVERLRAGIKAVIGRCNPQNRVWHYQYLLAVLQRLLDGETK